MPSASRRAIVDGRGWLTWDLAVGRGAATEVNNDANLIDLMSVHAAYPGRDVDRQQMRRSALIMTNAPEDLGTTYDQMRNPAITLMRRDNRVREQPQPVATGPLSQAAVEEFKLGLRGELLRPGDASYDDARRI